MWANHGTQANPSYSHFWKKKELRIVQAETMGLTMRKWEHKTISQKQFLCRTGLGKQDLIPRGMRVNKGFQLNFFTGF